MANPLEESDKGPHSRAIEKIDLGQVDDKFTLARIT
jgi:hypothetical protein